jgi:hypothetical protein
MESPIHFLRALFEQLGLEGTEIAINDFIKSHGP